MFGFDMTAVFEIVILVDGGQFSLDLRISQPGAQESFFAVDALRRDTLDLYQVGWQLKALAFQFQRLGYLTHFYLLLDCFHLLFVLHLQEQFLHNAVRNHAQIHQENDDRQPENYVTHGVASSFFGGAVHEHTEQVE
jgi:hypothetical protein